MQRGCEGWSVSRSASGELSGLLLAHFEGRSLCLLFFPILTFLKFIKLAAGRKKGRKKKVLCHTTSPWMQKHPGSLSGACPWFYILLEEEHLVSGVPRGGWREPPPPIPSPPPLLLLWTVSHAGFLVAGGGMVCEQGGIPFPLNNLLCQCSPNRALLQGCVLSLLNHRESLLNAPARDRESNTFGQ